MPVRVLVVDDSGFFRRRVTEMLNADPQIEVIGTAANGQEAIEQTRKLNPDVITMDIEMPVMDGITAVRRIMAIKPTPIMMFSSLTHEGAKPTLDALDAGAVDFLPKRFDDISRDREEAKRLLRMRVKAVGRQRRARPSTPAGAASGPLHARSRVTGVRPAAQPAAAPSAASRRHGSYKLVAIGTSTGGPVALQQVLTELPAGFPLPIVLVQHMPGTFTPAFAERLNQLCRIEVKEARNGDVLKPGVAYLAPGGKQMVLEGRGEMVRLKIEDGSGDLFYKPSVDVTFESIARIYPNATLAVILTGMGADGREGCRKLKQGGSTVWAQDEATCVVYGMPAAVVEAGIAERVLPLQKIGAEIVGSV